MNHCSIVHSNFASSLFLMQFPDTQSYVKVMTKLEVLNPIEVSQSCLVLLYWLFRLLLCINPSINQVVMPSTVCDGSTVTKLFNIISSQCSNANIATVQRKYFNENKGVIQQSVMTVQLFMCFYIHVGLQFVRQLVASEFNSVELEITTK